MSRPEALTDTQKRRLRRLKACRRELIRQLKALPSRMELAREFGVSERTIGRHLNESRKAVRCTPLRELYAW